MGKQNVELKDLQLAAVGSLSIASKYEEIFPPEMRDYRSICDNQYTIDSIMQMEYNILAKLKFDILHVSPLVLLKRYHFISQGSCKSLFLGQFILETSLLEYNTLEFSASIKASTCLLIARKLLEYEIIWPIELVVITGYSEEDLQECFIRLSQILSFVPKLELKSTKMKYSDKKYFEIYKDCYGRF